MLAGPEPARHQVVALRCVDLRDEIARRFSVEVHESTVGKWLHQLDLAVITSVPSIRSGTSGSRRYIKKLRWQSLLVCGVKRADQN